MKSRAVQALLVLLGIGLFVFATLPAYRVAEGLRQDKANNDQTLALSAELKQNREDLQDRFNRITDEEREGLRKLLPDTLDNVRLVNDISDIAQGQGLQIRNIAVGESGGKATRETTAAQDAASRKQRYGTLSLSFSTTATYGEFADLLRELERSLRLVDVRSIAIKSSPSKRYDFSLTLETYWLR